LPAFTTQAEPRPQEAISSNLSSHSYRNQSPDGASRVQILVMVLRQGVGMTAIGVAIGIG
jgi:hypothetical protein